MLKRTRQGLAGLFLAGTLAAAHPVVAQVAIQDGLVNVAIGNVIVNPDVAIGVAAQIAANICGVKVGPVAVLGVAADRSGQTQVVCMTGPQNAQVPVEIRN